MSFNFFEPGNEAFIELFLRRTLVQLVILFIKNSGAKIRFKCKGAEICVFY